jgi:thioredoxin reductase (NADPH)
MPDAREDVLTFPDTQARRLVGASMRRLRYRVSSNWLFVFIGASPQAEWLGAHVAPDDKGLVVTGQDLLSSAYARCRPLPRTPFGLETSVPGVFAAGDVRLDSTKRVASALGEGAMSVYFVHRYLATT